MQTAVDKPARRVKKKKKGFGEGDICGENPELATSLYVGRSVLDAYGLLEFRDTLKTLVEHTCLRNCTECPVARKGSIWLHRMLGSAVGSSPATDAQ